MTTSFTGDTGDLWDHYLHILQQDPNEPELRSVSTLPSAEKPDELGKPNEDLYGVRFVGDRAFMVTFERTDPLYTLDLSDPTAPAILGTLEVTGFSNFLHPVSDDLLLGLGQDENAEVKLELFDISDIANPVSRSVQTPVQGYSWSYSDAEYDRHAFSYLAGEETDRFTLPISRALSVFSEQASYGWIDSLVLMEVRDKNDPASASLNVVGLISGTANSGALTSGANRSVIADPAVYFVNGRDVYSALWADPSNATGPH